MDAIDVMTRTPVTAGPSTPVGQVAQLMATRRISGIPIIDEGGRILGIVTEGDLIRRAELGSEERAGGLLHTLFFGAPETKDYLASHGTTAADVMTRDIAAVAPDTTVRQIAQIFAKRGFRRVPVVEGDRLIGIVSRADLVRALASNADPGSLPTLNDRQIRDLILAEFARLPFTADSGVQVYVLHGIVTLWGYGGTDDERRAMRLAAESVPGVKAVSDHLRRRPPPFGIDELPSHRVTVIGRDSEA